ncbi:hypothetical protein ACQP2K_01390 [Microbispora siamensis]
MVLSRDGVRATGSPWWVDSLEVGTGESYDIAFVADNPGTINGHMFPDVPMFVVAEGDVVRVRIVNDSGEPHPMLHQTPGRPSRKPGRRPIS